MNKTKIFLIFTISIFMISLMQFELQAQAIKANVIVTLENLPLEQQEKLTNFQQVIEEYVNSSNWTNDELAAEFELSLQIFFSSFTGSSFEDRYGIQILISDNSDVQYFDRRCVMAYQPGDMLVHSDNNWTSLTSLLDFYVNIVIGEIFDKFELYMGTPYFEKAKTIAEQAKFGENRFQLGWDMRNDLIQDILSAENKKFREMKDFYYYGLYFAQDDVKKARMYCSAAVNLIEDVMKISEKYNEKCQKFLSAHHIELIDIFKESQNKEIFSKLIRLDPDHEDIYQEYL